MVVGFSDFGYLDCHINIAECYDMVDINMVLVMNL